MWISRYILTLHFLSSLFYHDVGGNCTTSISAYNFVLLLSTFPPTTNFVFPASSDTTSDEMHLVICKVFLQI